MLWFVWLYAFFMAKKRRLGHRLLFAKLRDNRDQSTALKTSDAFVPPNPKELDNATLMSIFFAL